MLVALVVNMTSQLHILEREALSAARGGATITDFSLGEIAQMNAMCPNTLQKIKDANYNWRAKSLLRHDCKREIGGT